MGAGLGYSLGHSNGAQSGLGYGLVANASAREIIVAELDTLNERNKQQALSLQTAEATIKVLTENIGDQQLAHESEIRELELYRRIEAGGSDRGLHVDEVQLVDLGDGPVLRITLLQVGARNDIQGEMGVALIGADLPGATDSRLVIADPESGTGLEFDYRFMTRIVVPMPTNLVPLSPSGQNSAWLEGLDLLEIDLIPRDSRGTPKRVTLPADRMIIGPAE